MGQGARDEGRRTREEGETHALPRRRRDGEIRMQGRGAEDVGGGGIQFYRGDFYVIKQALAVL